MATSPMPNQQPQGAGASPQGASSAPSQAPASQMQMLFARWYQTAQEIAQQNPVIASGMAKVAEGIQEAQRALVSQPQQTPVSQQPPL